MSLTKEWMLPVARILAKAEATDPVYALGDQITWLTRSYALRKLAKRGLLRNPDASVVPSLRNPNLIALQTFVEMLGFRDYYDIDLNGKASITCDFSRPLAPELRAQAGVVIDLGTCEHIFNLAQVFTNIVDLLKPGGMVLHVSPVSFYNHGFVNFNPIFFREFYEHNGFATLEHGLIVAPLEYPLLLILDRLGLEQRYYESFLDPISFFVDDESRITRRLAQYIGMGARASFLFAGQKPAAGYPVSFPCQAMYREARKDLTTD